MPVIPAFNGIVPTELLDLYPNETYYPLRHGFGHSGHEGCKLAKKYLKDQNLPQITRSNWLALFLAQIKVISEAMATYH